MKLSIDLINYLEEKGTWDSFRSEYNEIHKKDPLYANTFAGVLEIARGLNTENIPYLVIGGLAVASYLHQVDNSAFRNWRGTSDIDLVVSDKKIASRILNSADYKFKQSQPNKQGMVGRLCDYVKQDDGEITVVGLRTGIRDKTGRDVTNKFVKNSAKIPVHGVQISVPKLKDLIYMKRWANRGKDKSDIRTLKKIFSNI